MPLKEKIIVGVGDMAVSKAPGGQLVTYALGSCIGLFAYDPLIKAGGLIHIMLPEATEDASGQNPFMFADTGLPIFFEELFKLGCMKVRLKVKLAGGASLFDDKKMFNIGERNYNYIVNYLRENNYALLAETIGGTNSRTMTSHLDTGKVFIKIPGIGEVEL
jgi:chemotaxis protein CheD